MTLPKAFLHWCEVCGLELLLEPEIAYAGGWDFPPRMGEFGVISPRTCGECGIEGTVWWAMAVEKKTVHDLTDEQYAKALRMTEGEKRLLAKATDVRSTEGDQPRG